MNVNHKLRMNIAFVAAVLSMILLYASSGAPISLFSTYQGMLGLTKANLSAFALSYFIGTCVSLLFLGEISNYLTRRLTIILTIFISIIGCLCFLVYENFITFLIGRFLMGIACGLASSAVGSYIVDTTPNGNTQLASIVTSGSVLFGLCLGTFISAVIVTYNESLIHFVYIFMISLLILTALLVLIGEETVKFKHGVIKTLKPKIYIPQEVRGVMIPMAFMVFGTWAIGGFYQAYASTIAINEFHINSTILSAAIFSSMMLPQLIGNQLIKFIENKKAQIYGETVFVITIGLLILSLKFNMVYIFLVISVISSVCVGLIFASGMENILKKITQNQRAEVLAALYLISYAGAGIPNFAVSLFGNSYSIIEIMIGYLILVIITAIFAGIYIKKGDE